MKKKIDPQKGLIIAAAGFFVIVILSYVFFGGAAIKVLDTDVISWAAAAEKCKAKYKDQRSPGLVKVSNCRKRLWDDDYFYFYWSKPLSIFIKTSAGKQSAHSGTCQVSRTKGDIVYMTLDKKEIVKKSKK